MKIKRHYTKPNECPYSSIGFKKVKSETKKYLILTPPNHNIISPLPAINIEVPKSGWDKTKIIGIKIIVKAIKILISELIFSIFTLW